MASHDDSRWPLKSFFVVDIGEEKLLHLWFFEFPFVGQRAPNSVSLLWVLMTLDGSWFVFFFLKGGCWKRWWGRALHQISGLISDTSVEHKPYHPISILRMI